MSEFYIFKFVIMETKSRGNFALPTPVTGQERLFVKKRV